jgi:hypothetical protein
MASTLVSRTDGGGTAPSIWRFTGYYGAQFISNTWRPERQRKTSDTLMRGTFSIGYAMATNVVKEFWPDIKRIVFRK